MSFQHVSQYTRNPGPRIGFRFAQMNIIIHIQLEPPEKMLRSALFLLALIAFQTPDNRRHVCTRVQLVRSRRIQQQLGACMRTTGGHSCTYAHTHTHTSIHKTTHTRSLALWHNLNQSPLIRWLAETGFGLVAPFSLQRATATLLRLAVHCSIRERVCVRVCACVDNM